MHAFVFDGRSSEMRHGDLEIATDGTLRLVEGEAQVCYPIAEVSISERLGNTPRTITLPDGRLLEVGDVKALEQALEACGDQRAVGWIHHLESRYTYVIIALLFTLVFVWGSYRYLLPAFAEQVAEHLPLSIHQQFGDQVLEVLDQRIFSPSQLTESRQAGLQTRFARLAATVGDGHALRLLFRDGGETLGANAFALPSGVVVVTDQLVALAENDEQLVAVMAHEIGHVVRRHGIRQTLQNSVVGLFFVYVTGDAGSLVMALPILLLELGYSREFEREADDFAVAMMRAEGIDTSHFTTMLRRLESQQRGRETGMAGDGAEVDDTLYNYLSTHPETEERITRIGD